MYIDKKVQNSIGRQNKKVRQETRRDTDTRKNFCILSDCIPHAWLSDNYIWYVYLICSIEHIIICIIIVMIMQNKNYKMIFSKFVFYKIDFETDFYNLLKMLNEFEYLSSTT